MYNTIKSPYNKVMENKMVVEVMLEKLIRVGLRYYNMYYWEMLLLCVLRCRMAAHARDSAAAAAATAAANKTTALQAYIKDSTVVIISTVGVKYL